MPYFLKWAHLSYFAFHISYFVFHISYFIFHSVMKPLFIFAILLGILPMTACSKTTLAAGTTAAAVDTTAVAPRDSLPNNGMCVTLRMEDGTQQLIYLRVHPAVRQQPRQMVVSTPLTTITYERNDVVRHQPGKALLAGTSTAGLPAAAKSLDRMNERILFFGLPKNSHINIVTDTNLQWRDEDIEGDTYALILTQLPRGSYIISMNATVFRVELK